MKRASSPRSTTSSINGFTLIELMIAVVILAILLGIAVPSFTSTIRGNEIIANTSNLLSALNEARSEASKRSANVSICASTDGSTCSGSTTWSSGWIVFTDADGVIGTLDGADKLLKSINATSGIDTISNGVYAVTFVSTGAVTNHASPPSEISFQITKNGCGAGQERVLTIWPATGRMKITASDCP